MMRAGVTRGLGAGRFVVGVALGVGLARVTDAEGEGVVRSTVDGRAEGVATDWQAPTSVSRLATAT